MNYLIFLFQSLLLCTIFCVSSEQKMMGASELTFTPPWLSPSMPPAEMWDYNESQKLGYWVLKPEYRGSFLPSEYTTAYKDFVEKRYQRHNQNKKQKKNS